MEETKKEIKKPKLIEEHKINKVQKLESQAKFSSSDFCEIYERNMGKKVNIFSN